MTKRMLIDDTQPEETRVVVVNGNKLEEVEFEILDKIEVFSRKIVIFLMFYGSGWTFYTKFCQR